jgi:PAS domain S-box-containing protein
MTVPDPSLARPPDAAAGPAGHRRSEESLRLLVESVRDYAIFLLDSQGYILTWNRGARAIKLYQDEEIIGRHFSVFYTKEDQAAGRPAQVLRMAAAEGRFEAEGWRVRKDGSLFWADVVITAVHDEQGRLIGFGKVTRDLTERKLAEEAQVQLQAEQAARAAAEATAREREEFLSVAAHELRTPITSLKGFTELSLRQLDRQGPLDLPRLRNALQVAHRQADKVAHLIDQLLEISRLRRGKLVLDRAPADLVELVQETVNAAQVHTRQHTLTVQAPPDLIASVDAVRLEQVLTNLLDNAIKFSPHGGAIEVEVARPEEQTARISVRDHGLGIPVEERPHIFEQFHQGHALDHRSGLGLGLYISHQIVARHGGQLLAEFPEDGGTRFVLLLPLAAEPPLTAEPPPPSSP